MRESFASAALRFRAGLAVKSRVIGHARHGTAQRLRVVTASGTGIADAEELIMRGFITEQDFTAVEVEFPGIVSLYEHLATKPPTFLDLVRLYLSSDSPDVLSGSARPAFRPTA